MAHARRSRFVRPAPRTKMWIGNNIGTTNLPAATNVLVGVLNSAAKALRPFTILRTRTVIQYRSDQQVATEFAFGQYGQLIVTDSASAAGIASIPDPSTEPEASWHVHQVCFADFVFADATGFDANGGAQYVIDSKAMRKVGIDDDCVIIFAQVAGVGAQLTVQGRVLIQLH